MARSSLSISLIGTGIAALLMVIAWFSGYPWPVIAAGLLLVLCWQLVQMSRLRKKLTGPEKTKPVALTGWRELFDLVDLVSDAMAQKQRESRETIQQLQSLTSAFPDPAIAIDESDIITWFNEAARNLLGLRNPQDIGQVLTNFCRDPDFAEWLSVKNEMKGAHEMQAPGDERIWLEVTSVPFRESHCLVLLRDISNVRSVDQVRRDFVANISHELRTPLTVLLGYLEMLAPDVSEDNAIAVDRMYNQARQMQSMLDDLLELARLQNGKLVNGEEDVDIPAVLMQLKEQAEELSGGRHTLEFTVQDGLQIHGNAQDIESAFRNLIINAVNYTPAEGSVRVHWREEYGSAVLSVRDTGIGIPNRDIPRLTERFYRVGSDRARQSGGTGLGLSIVKHILNAHQARLLIDSELGAGSDFRCVFPAERVVTVHTNCAVVEEHDAS